MGGSGWDGKAVEWRPAGTRPASTREGRGRRPDVMGLAVTAGLLVFLVAESLPGGLTGVKAFFLGAGVVVALVAGMLVLAVVVGRRRPDWHTALLAEAPHAGDTTIVGLDNKTLRQVAGQLALLYVDLPRERAAQLADLLRLWDVIEPHARRTKMLRLAEHATDDGADLPSMTSRLDKASPSQLIVLVKLIEGGSSRDR